MKCTFLFLSLFICSFFVSAQQDQASISMQSDYGERVFYDFSEGQAENFDKSSWDIAFLSNSQFNFASRINAGKGIEVYQASQDTADWDNLDPGNLANFTQLYNSDTTWTTGAFEKGTATYGWGEYNSDDHVVEGTVLFMLKYPNGSFKKFWLKSFADGYTFKYASWNVENETWENEQTFTLPNSTNPDRLFNYYSLENDEVVVAEPQTSDWDIVFKQYSTEVQPGTPYTVTGVFNHPKFEVAQNTQTEVGDYPQNPDYQTEVNTIGYDWKSFNGSGYTLENDRFYYLKNVENETIYQLHFTNFEGSATGNVEFNYENITSQLSTVKLNKEQEFSLYPNPTINKKATLLFDNNSGNAKATVQVFNLSGQKILQTKLNPGSGFYKKELNFSSFSSGTYVVKFKSGQRIKTEKLIVN